MADREALEIVRAAFGKAFSVAPESVTPESSPLTIEGWDSLGHLGMTDALGEEAGLTFEVEEILEMEDVGAILRVLKRRLAA